MPERIRILVVDDHHVVRQGLVALLNIVPDIEVVGEASDGLQAIDLHKTLQPDITLMDLQLPNLGGVDAILKIRADYPAARFIVLTTFDGDEDIFRSLQAGAKAYLLKGMTVDELVSTIQAVHSGRTLISPAIAEKLAERMSTQALTNRELKVLERIVAGRANKEIASDLQISEATVKSHINSLLGKLGVSDRTHAATVALQRGIVHLK
ncbi:response regulator [Tunturiibacter gelidoferens]|jgi:DNA-binding NarL/FixJ family response regulator|uniref:Two-component system NarL family response regulator n=1 Tax=Tunturiibacter gelidiferens TaxID=3069689 RepID=A0A9X0QGF9_9BACT|nr:response regulator transcription factor [Edaphobacter lichenicola]MBB5329744.1 two-component system NarL family response regulator [Edaphobacter lichenicola]